MSRSAAGIRNLCLEIIGWVLVVAGIAMLVLPGPGLLGLFAGLAILSQRYDWARRRVDPVKRAALEGASDSVQTWPRIVGTLAGVVALAACGVLWFVGPAAPSWWPVDERWWLLGGKGTGTTILVSAAVALGLEVYSFRRFRHSPYVHRPSVDHHSRDSERRSPGRQ